MPDRSLAEWLTLIESRHPSEIELGLGRVAEVWHRLLQQPRLNQCKPPLAITVAGTNGKGSCITSMQALLLQHGHSVGTFTSPHFLAWHDDLFSERDDGEQAQAQGCRGRSCEVIGAAGFKLLWLQD